MAGSFARKILLRLCGIILWFAATFAAAVSQAEGDAAQNIFVSSEQCIACHSNLFDMDGNDISIGHSWRSTMMALSAKDPYWMAGVRRELIDHPTAAEAIEDTCSVCHMPMARTIAAARGEPGRIFDHLQGTYPNTAETAIGADGVSCTTCHQIKADNFGDHSSFDGGYIIDTSPAANRQVFGPFEVDQGRTRIMQSASSFVPGAAPHIQRSELCATCHTLITKALDDNGNVVGEFPEQVPYLEWQHSDYRNSVSCQDCHMPVVAGKNKVSSVLGEARDDVSQHVFLGGNAFMLGIINRYRDELNVTVPQAELARAVKLTEQHLSSATARVAVESLRLASEALSFDVVVENLAGHKLPTAYPSRRVWLHVTVRDQDGRTIFESGAPRADGSIAGNDNDADGSAFEPHYDEIVRADQVQIYEPVLLNNRDEVTTSLLSAVRYAKDNRLLPRGFDKASAGSEIATYGGALADSNFASSGDTVRYRIARDSSVSTVSVSARLMFQPIGYRWAHNLQAYDTFETNRFVGYFRDNAASSASLLAEGRRSSAPE